jgi:hypothetical protein
VFRTRRSWRCPRSCSRTDRRTAWCRSGSRRRCSRTRARRGRHCRRHRNSEGRS